MCRTGKNYVWIALHMWVHAEPGSPPREIVASAPAEIDQRFRKLELAVSLTAVNPWTWRCVFSPYIQSSPLECCYRHDMKRSSGQSPSPPPSQLLVCSCCQASSSRLTGETVAEATAAAATLPLLLLTPRLLFFLSSPLCLSLSLSALLPLFLLPLSVRLLSLSLWFNYQSLPPLCCATVMQKRQEEKRETLTISGAACSSNDPNRRLLVCTLTHPIGHNHISFSIHPFTHRLFSCALNTRGPPVIKLILLIWKAAMTVWLAHRRGGQTSFETKQRGSVNHYATISGQKASSGHPPAILPALLPPLFLWKLPYTRNPSQLMCYNWPIWASTIALPRQCRKKTPFLHVFTSGCVNEHLSFSFPPCVSGF